MLFASPLVWGQDATDDKALILAIMKAQENAWNEGDIPGFMKHYWEHDSLKFISKSGITYGWKQTLTNYQRSYPDKKAMGTLWFTIKDITQLAPDYVFVIGQWQLIKEKPAGGHFTLLWRKLSGRWLIVSDHTS